MLKRQKAVERENVTVLIMPHAW